jgi:hypothetical protein
MRRVLLKDASKHKVVSGGDSSYRYLVFWQGGVTADIGNFFSKSV